MNVASSFFETCFSVFKRDPHEFRFVHFLFLIIPVMNSLYILLVELTGNIQLTERKISQPLDQFFEQVHFCKDIVYAIESERENEFFHFDKGIVVLEVSAVEH
jgi:hypothetical protein